MKKILTTVFAALLIVSALACCNKNANESNKTASAFKAQEGDIVVTLDANPTTGYNWILDSKPAKVTVVSSLYEAAKVAPGVVGSGGKQIITLRPVNGAKGTEDVRFIYIRSWEKDITPARVHIEKIDLK